MICLLTCPDVQRLLCESEDYELREVFQLGIFHAMVQVLSRFVLLCDSALSLVFFVSCSAFAKAELPGLPTDFIAVQYCKGRNRSRTHVRLHLLRSAEISAFGQHEKPMQIARSCPWHLAP